MAYDWMSIKRLKSGETQGRGVDKTEEHTCKGYDACMEEEPR